ncbi:MAG: KOW domain-containing RNA-binding protein [Bacillota bacterium]|nr:KOW domain-containing RNA-binding protein [Bacillota bacterium]
METTEDLQIGQLVKSKAGRDKGKLFIIKEIINDKYVYIVDGELRKISNPKKKKVKHLIIYKRIFKEFQEQTKNSIKLTNVFVKKLIEPYEK